MIQPQAVMPADNASARADGEALFHYVLRQADTSLVLAQRLGEWVGHAPAFEEDLALANIALDLLGQARHLLTYGGTVEGRGRTEDDLAFLRDGVDFFNHLIVEQPNRDFGYTIVRQFFVDVFQRELFGEMRTSADSTLSAIAAKALKETEYHCRFSGAWVIRLGDGTVESHGRVQAAVDDLWRFTGEFFAADSVDERMSAIGVAPALASLEPRWRAVVEDTLRLATLAVPVDNWVATGGKQGRHGEQLGRLLAEMQYLQRSHPGASW